MNRPLTTAFQAALRGLRRLEEAGRPLLVRAGKLAGAAKARKVASFWDENVGRHCAPFAHWESPAPIQQALNKLVTGDIHVHPPMWFLQQFGPFAEVAELGCGDGILAQFLLQIAPDLKIDAYDISPASLAKAAQRIEAHFGGVVERCSFRRVDLNAESLPEGAYDAILSTGAMHHVENLDFCFKSIRRALRPQGYFWLNDYVGPNRFQWSDAQMRLADELLAQVPKVWRLRDKVGRCDERALRDMDPSEAVRSQHIEAALAAHFEIVHKSARGGTLLAPIFGSGCLDAAMAESPEGLSLLAAMFETEQDLIRSGALGSDHYAYVAKPRLGAEDMVQEAFERCAGAPPEAARMGIGGDLQSWLELNERAAFGSVRAREWVAPFPPVALMHRTSGLEDDRQFAEHGVAILRALAAASPKPLTDFKDLLDFGVGVGRAARLFKGFKGRYVGVDVDGEQANWLAANMPWVEAVTTEPRGALPFAAGAFDAVVSISVFTHMNEADQLYYLDELRRVTRPGALLFLTVSGKRVLDRAFAEPAVAVILALPEQDLARVREAFDHGSGFCFLLQQGHLTSERYDYGITFISEDYVARTWSQYFEAIEVVRGAIHDFQDLVVLRRRDQG